MIAGIFLLLLRSQAQECPSFVDQAPLGVAMTCGVPCQLTELSRADQCRFDVSACGDNVPAGTSCPITCRSPFTGQASVVTCPPGNTNINTPAEWLAPECDLFASDCPRSDMPEAYEEALGGGWQCAEGYAGDAVARCVPDAQCQSTLQWFGCEKTSPCAPPSELIGCLLDVTQCAEVKPGGSCPVSCRFPYTGWSSVALCRPDNVDESVGLLVVQPECTLTCEDPPNEPEGYVLTAEGWRCAPGFGGTAVESCVIDSVCASKKVLSGCSQLARCILPNVENSCMFDFTECIGASDAGSSCRVHCKRPYLGNSTTASCPAGNTNPLQELTWQIPSCEIACGELSDVPVGYLSHPYLRVYGGWQCTGGFSGQPVISCGTDANCNPQIQFSGCRALLPCDPPILTGGQQCSIQHTCISVGSGNNCEVSCRPPYVGGIALATCPPNNTILGRELIWAVPDCNLQCPMPDPIPTGYVSPGVDQLGQPIWACAAYFEGMPEVKCRIQDSNCVAQYEFSGCVPQTTCSLPSDAPCSVDWSQCHNVFAGGSCNVFCGPSFTGNVTEATCPEGNIDPSTVLDWSFPGCELTCEDPTDPLGYVKTRFMCAENYSGFPSSRCAADFADSCNPTYSFSGCNLVVPCAPPRIGGRGARLTSYSQEDALCMFDFSDCQRVLPGQNCTIRCGSDYLGRSTMAYCPSDNTDPNGELVYLEPTCHLKPCDLTPPVGYVETPCGWTCDEGYIGDVSARCAAVGSEPGRCSSELIISGCTLTVECAPLAVNDTCRTNASLCTRLQPGQGCNVTCASPYTGGEAENATWAYCPGSTTRQGQQPLWGTALGEWAIDCEVECAMPNPVPAGYVFSENRWSCDTAQQYSGTALGECIVNDTTCEPEFILSGCFPTTPCDFPVFDACQHDMSACPSDGKLVSGTSCQVSCKAPYTAPLGELPGSMECLDPNIDPLGVVWQPPTCILGCAEPSSQVGYRNVLGVWSCAAGYSGPGAIWSECVVDPESCVAFPRLFGCQPFVGCLSPTLTPLQICTVDFENGNCQDLGAGDVCTVYCKSPYIGDQLAAGCPSSNIDPTKVINWQEPTCYCPPPSPLPAGYWYLGLNSYRCAPGYFGAARYRCEIDTTTCQPNIILTGCAPLTSCATPHVDSYELCKLDLSECVDPIAPGESCNVSCKAGFNVNATYPECPADNTDASYRPDLDIYCGEYTCLSADNWAAQNPLPRGYDVGTWRCADGFRGSVSSRCTQSDECGGTLQLFGCVPLQACSLPRLMGRDACRYNFSNCEDTASGDFCEFQCQPPFRSPPGRPGRAFCKPDNVDPGRELEFTEPECLLECPDPVTAPPGYMKTECGWQCAPGYEGRAMPECDVDDECMPRLRLHGCAREEKCQVPIFDVCKFNFSACGETPPGESCSVRCLPPYLGGMLLARCPEGNTVPFKPLDFAEEHCYLSCPAPVPLPRGYEQVNQSDQGAQGDVWRCSAGFVGMAMAECVQEPNCGAPELRLRGCEENVPCTTPELDACQYESTCGPQLPPGASCEIACRAPYEGNSSEVFCPDPNTRKDGPATWESLNCSLTCPEMDLQSQPNYTIQNGELMCVEGAVGMAMAECRVDSSCRAFWYFWGCLMLQPCRVPPLDACRTDIGNCTDVLPGEFCILSCQPNFIGEEVIGRCPVDNTDAAQPLQFDGAVRCNCTAPEPRIGYELVRADVDSGEWRCQDEWAGQAAATCKVDEQCRANVSLSGCRPLRQCAPPPAEYFVEECQQMQAGETCVARCAAHQCVEPGEVTFRCPMDNLNAQQPPLWISGKCRMRCGICRTGVFLDTDPRPKMLQGSLQFGEAHASGSMPVMDIHGYHVFFADSCGQRLGPSLGYVPRLLGLVRCCAQTAYTLEISGAIPLDATTFFIAINTSYGELPFPTEVDFSDLQETAAPTTLKPITALGHKASVSLLAMLALAFAHFVS